MLKLTKIIVLLGLVTLGVQAAEKRWWETASFYQIYPRSFKDSDGDGIGDIKGITQELAYLKEIGITATWLSPVFTSPMADFGYDISNFTEIDPMFGTMEDFDELLKTAKALNVKIILDFVPNHSSDECDWFVRSAARDPEYENFYVWHPGKMVNGVRQPPTNWVSVFRGSAWQWHEGRQEYYLHQFVSKQPDFNYRNPKVVEAMNEVLRFWLRKGVSGFRIDAVPHIFEATDASGNWADEPRNTANNDPADYGYLNHIYTVNQQETVDLIYEFRKVLDEHTATHSGEEPILMTEAYAPIDYLMKFYGNGTAEGAQIPFNFELISTLNKESNAHQYANSINQWLSNMPEGRTANWVMGNHDKNRIGSRMGADRMDMINMMLLTLPGCSITFNGEEIGMTDVWISWEESVDPQGCNSSPEEYERLTRDPVRTPFQWNDKPFAGFTEGNRTWLPVAEDYKLVNVKRQRGIPKSHLNVYKQVQQLRRAAVFRNGDTEVKALSDNVMGIKRFVVGEYIYIVLMNLSDHIENLNAHAAFDGLTPELEYTVVTDKSVRRNGDRVFADSILLLPKEAVILRTTEALKQL